LFKLIESNKESLKLEAYSLSQTTLEQVFLSFAKEQKGLIEKSGETAEDEEKTGLFKRVWNRIKSINKT
jgi:hypothetical protein